MEVDDSETEAPNVLVLPQADVPTNALSIYNDSTSSTRRTKRKRSELAELSDFVSKRRSTRVNVFCFLIIKIFVCILHLIF